MAADTRIKPILPSRQKEEVKEAADEFMSYTEEYQREVLAYIQGYKACEARMSAHRVAPQTA